MRNLVILISGGGSNMAAIVAASRREDWAGRFNAQVATVISSRADAGGLALAHGLGVPTSTVDAQAFTQQPEPAQAFERALGAAVDRYAPHWLVLAGFMRILSADFVARYAGRIVNIHPSLLPAFAGLHTHRRALQAGCRFAGATVHRVTAQLDAGPILGQAVVPVLPGDTEAALAARVLSQEHALYPRVLRELLQAPEPSL